MSFGACYGRSKSDVADSGAIAFPFPRLSAVSIYLCLSKGRTKCRAILPSLPMPDGGGVAFAGYTVDCRSTGFTCARLLLNAEPNYSFA